MYVYTYQSLHYNNYSGIHMRMYVYKYVHNKGIRVCTMYVNVCA